MSSSRDRILAAIRDAGWEVTEDTRSPDRSRGDGAVGAKRPAQLGYGSIRIRFGRAGQIISAVLPTGWIDGTGKADAVIDYLLRNPVLVDLNGTPMQVTEEEATLGASRDRR